MGSDLDMTSETSTNLPSPIAEVAESLNDDSPNPVSGTIFFPPSAPPSLSPPLPPTSGSGAQEDPREYDSENRRGSQESMTGGYGGLPPTERQQNPRRGSATGSYGIPVPPEWLKAYAEGRRAGSRPSQYSPHHVGLPGKGDLKTSRGSSGTFHHPRSPRPASSSPHAASPITVRSFKSDDS